jgi:hypothetical protein
VALVGPISEMKMAVWVAVWMPVMVVVVGQATFFHRERALMTMEADDAPMAAAPPPVVGLGCLLSCLPSKQEEQKKQALLNQAYLLNNGVAFCFWHSTSNS